MKRLVLHIGTEKTGSTAIQHALYAQRKTLEDHGVALLDGFGEPNNRQVAALFGQRDLKNDLFYDLQLDTLDKVASYLSVLEQRLHKAPKTALQTCHTVIITSEHFHSRLKDPASV